MYPEERSTDNEGTCANCHQTLLEGEKYCRYCGTERGDEKFEPYRKYHAVYLWPYACETRSQMHKMQKEVENNADDCRQRILSSLRFTFQNN